MSPAYLTIHTEDGSYQLPCPPHALLKLGSAEDADIALVGIDILRHHCTLRRISERRFTISAASRDARCTINGVTAADLEVDMPFRFTIGGEVIDFDIISESTGDTNQPARRRDYLLGPISLRQRSNTKPTNLPRELPVESLSPVSAPIVSTAPVIGPQPMPKTRRSIWEWAAIISFIALLAVFSDEGLMWLSGRLPEDGQKTEPVIKVEPVPVAEVVVPAELPKLIQSPPSQVVMPAVPVPDLKAIATREASAHVRAFILSWNDESAAGVLEFISAAASTYFNVPNPASDAVLRMEEELRARWPIRTIKLADEPVTSMMSETSVEVLQRFHFELRGMNRDARGTGELRCTLERDAAKKWRILKAADNIEVTALLPDKVAFSPATSLRELKPALSEEESRQLVIDHINDLIKAGSHKSALTAILKASIDYPKDTFWRFATDKICESLAHTLFAEGKWPDVTCVEEIKSLSDSGLTSAMLLHGHVLRAGYGMKSNLAEGEFLYRKAYEISKSREARFYYAEALFIGNEFEKASAIALSAMTSSQHPLEAYLAAHLLWKKAEIDPALWQQVYETVSRIADKHPPAKNLAGLVLLRHGQTTKERNTGFAAIKAAAEAGVPEAMKNLIACYEMGTGCEQNPAEAEVWKTKLATTKPPQRKHYSEWVK